MSPRKPSAALIVATVAVFIALGGTAVAGGYLVTSVGQIKPSVRHALQGARGPRGFSGAQGARGATGANGSTGATGSPGVLGVTTITGASVPIPAGQAEQVPNATCPAGSTVIGTGFVGPLGGVGGFVEKFGTFVGGFFDNESSVAVNANVQAICAQLPAGAVAASVHDSRARYNAEVERSRKALAQVR